MPASSTETCLITAAAGKQATELIPLLLPLFARLRLVVLTPQSRSKLAVRYPTAEVVAADLNNGDSVREVMRGVACAYIIGPTFHPRETAIVKSLIDAAEVERQKAGFKHLVYSSVLHPDISALANHEAKRVAEVYLHEHGPGLRYTILQPSHFADNFPIRQLLEQIDLEVEGTADADPELGPELGHRLEQGKEQEGERHRRARVQTLIFTPTTNPHVPFSFSTTHDCARAAASVLSEREPHFYATYELVSVGGERSITYLRATELVQEAINTRLAARPVPRPASLPGSQARTAEEDRTRREVRVRIQIRTATLEVSLDRLLAGVPAGTPAAVRPASEFARRDAATARKLIEYYDRRGLYGNSLVLETLLGRPPLAFASWAALRVAQVWDELGMK